MTHANSRGAPLNEEAALALLVRTLKHDEVYNNRISLDCVTYENEETTDAYFQFVLREIRNAKCSGDPETNPTIDRYRVYRAYGRIKWLKAIDDIWQTYNPAKIR
jgi:hypothetical protein